MNTDMDMDISWMQKCISIFVLNKYEYKLDTENMDINIDINQMIKFYDYRIKDNTK